MDIVAGLTGLVIGAAAGCVLAYKCAAAEVSRRRAQFQAQADHWKDTAERARAKAARVGEQAAAWAAGCQQGRDDVLLIARALALHANRADDDPAAS